MTRPSNIQYLAAASLLTVFVINILTPPAFLIDILYLTSIVIVLGQNSRTIITFSAAACVLIVINALFFDWQVKGGLSVWANRGISLFAICITCYVAIRYRKQTRAAMLKEHRYMSALEAMLFMVSHEVRRPVANIMGLVDAMCTDSADLSKDNITELCSHFQSSAIELDTFIKTLNTFMEQAGKEHSHITRRQ